jgi:hypothetical protein
MVASAFGNTASIQGLGLENLRWRKGRPLYHFAEGVFVLRTFGGEDDPNSSLFAVLDRFFVTSSVREKHKGFRMSKVRKTPSLSLLSKNN